MARYALQNGQLSQIFLTALGHSDKALALDSRGQAWVASGGDNCVYLLSDQGTLLGHFIGGGMDGPWGITVDGDDNVWVGNFGPEKLDNDFTTSSLTKLAGSNPDSRPPDLETGDPISPPTGYTLPSAGAEVLLQNGEPLYGSGGPPSFSPLMRITSVVIDRAGNIWATNNWKPDFTIDLINSGGDGMCIFVGLAKPGPKYRVGTGESQIPGRRTQP